MDHISHHHSCRTIFVPNTNFTVGAFIRFQIADTDAYAAVLLLHKSALVAALLENPANPLSTEFTPSLLSANRCASLLTQTLVGQFEEHPEAYLHFWFPWVQGFCAAMIFGSIGVRSPGCTLAGAAVADLSSVVELFQKGEARGSRRAAIVLVS